MNQEQYQKHFTPYVQSQLYQATYHLSWLLSHGYAIDSSLKLVGDRFRFHQEIRKALKRASCSAFAFQKRRENQVDVDALRNQTVWIDGFNLLITIERALRGDPVLKCQDGVIRDIAGIHGTYRKGNHTQNACSLIMSMLELYQVNTVRWLFDRPISNSGKMAHFIRQTYQGGPLHCEVDVVQNPDLDLIHAPDDFIILSGDGWILENCTHWYNLTLDLFQPNSLCKEFLNHFYFESERSPSWHKSLWLIDLSIDPPLLSNEESGSL